eukprot:comp12056_c0_seq1/m.6766 comp12056_c0_seq1/g.6766  ORF comp12056_c0_seq1/g.6766 comp12056_c0_seq1/m.6766 type:complete len:217 (-) comp12056_c0_seq1:93-743(-)
MLRFTMLARVIDGLPLAASMEDDSTDRDLGEYKNQAKMLFKKLSDSSPARLSIDTGPMCFHYIIEMGVCYLVLCDGNYPKNHAFAYLEELQREFQAEYGREVGTAARPYAFVKFDTVMQRVKRNYQDVRARSNVTRLNAELQDVQRVMTQNIQEIIGRGERLDKIGDMASEMKEHSKAYLKDAKYVNWQEMYRKYGPLAVVGLVVILFIYVRYSWF